MGVIFELFAAWLGRNATKIIQEIVKWLTKNWIFTMSCALTTIICLVYQAIKNPEGAINEFLINVLSSVLILFPSTPEDLKVASLLVKFNESFPQVGSYVLGEIFSGIVGLATVFFVVKLWKMLPFI